MNRDLQYLLSLLEKVFTQDTLNELALKTRFKERQRKLTPDMFVTLAISHGEDLCTSSLSQLCARLERDTGVSLSPQALDKHFNKHSVDFLKQLFEELLITHLLYQQDDPLMKNGLLSIVKLVDSSVIQLPQNLKDTYIGPGGDSSKAALKIQLEYELLSGKITNCLIDHAKSCDVSYLAHIDHQIERNGLYLKDLGYFKLKHLEHIDEHGGYYISKIKSGLTLYKKNDQPPLKADGTIDKRKLYKKIDIHEIAQPLAEGQSINYMDTYIGLNKLKSRFIVTKLTPECKKNREKKYRLDVRKRKKSPKEGDKTWNSINTYVTNIPPSIATNDQIHGLYTLRWQIENIFKVWKSVFKIDAVKKVKTERFQCFLYGRLIQILLATSIVEVSRRSCSKDQSTVSEMKAFRIAKEYLSSFGHLASKQSVAKKKWIQRILQTIAHHGKKDKKKGHLSSIDVLDFIRNKD